MSKIEEEEPALLLVECGRSETEMVMLNEENVLPELKATDEWRESQVWYLDNCASNHMTGQKGKFRYLDESMIGVVRFGDGSTVDIKGKGTVAFKYKNGEEKLLQNVYFIPILKNNIVSLGQISEDGNKIVLDEEYLLIFDKKGRLLMRIKRSVNRMYKIALKESTSLCLIAKTEKKTWLWHTRVGHVNFQALTRMLKERMAYGIPDLVQPKKTCEGCLMSKQARKAFLNQTTYHAKEP